jgi:L-amino acid N-acyltransferase YncA
MLQNPKPGKLRKLILEDKYVVLSWRNDSETIAASISGEPVDLEEHEIWFSNLLGSKSDHAYIATDNLGNQLCFIYFSQRNINKYEISINVNPDFRGQGIATLFLPIAISEFRSLQKVELVARILESNVNSKKLFEGIGFRDISEENQVIKIYSLH